MIKIEAHISLTKGTRLNGPISNPQVMSQEVIKNIPNAGERFLVVQNRVDGDNGEVTVQSSLPPQDGAGDRTMAIHHDSHESTRHEGLQVNKSEWQCGHWRSGALFRRR